MMGFPLNKLLQKINLGDQYALEARVYPALIIVLPVTILAIQAGRMKGSWLAAAGLGAGVEIALALYFSRVGHARGAKLQDRLEKKWGGLPTHTWLLPSDKTHSQQQRELWIKAVEALSGLDLHSPKQTEDFSEFFRSVSDAIMACRNKLRVTKNATFLFKQNIYYGFSRNLAGLAWWAVALSLLSLSASSYIAYLRQDPASLIFIVLISAFLVVSFMFACGSESYVMHCAIRYSEAFFDAVTKATSKPRK